MIIVIHPQYEYLRSWIEQLPQTFASTGDIIYDARNQIRHYQTEGLSMCVKRFHQPRFLNRFIYTCLRPSKAKRSYENGLYLIQHQVGTPQPIAYIEERIHGLLGYSYLITKQSTLTHLNREFTLNYRPALDETIRPLARFTAHMHEKGILHLDYSPGNILWDQADGEYQFEIVDINRMRIGQPVTLKEGAYSLRRLSARTSFFLTFADEYAKARNMDPVLLRQLVLHYRDRFWHNGRKARYDYDRHHPISFAITVCNEAEELKRLLQTLTENISQMDEIVIQADTEHVTEAVNEVIRQYQNQITTYAKYPLNYDFAAAKNHLNSLCRGEYIFQLDADELPQPWLLQHLQEIVDQHPCVELFKLPRLNCFQQTEDRPVEKYVAWPDYQGRLYRNCPQRIRWRRPLHERIHGHRLYWHLPKEDQYAILHTKIKQQDTSKWEAWRQHYQQ